MPTTRRRSRRTALAILRPAQRAFLTGDRSHLANGWDEMELRAIEAGAEHNGMSAFRGAIALLEAHPTEINAPIRAALDRNAKERNRLARIATQPKEIK